MVIADEHFLFTPLVDLKIARPLHERVHTEAHVVLLSTPLALAVSLDVSTHSDVQLAATSDVGLCLDEGLAPRYRAKDVQNVNAGYDVELSSRFLRMPVWIPLLNVAIQKFDEVTTSTPKIQDAPSQQIVLE